MRETMPDPPGESRRWAPPRVRIRALILMIAAIGGLLGVWRFVGQNAGPRRAWVSHQLRALGHDDPAYRRTAAEALGGAGDGEARRVAPPLIRALGNDPDPGVRRASARSLGLVLPRGPESRAGGIGAGPATGALIAALSDPDGDVRLAAIQTLGNLHFGAPGPSDTPPGPDPGPTLRALDGVARDPGDILRAEALRWIGRLTPPGRGAPPVLLDASGDASEEVRIAALEALGRSWDGAGPRWANAGEVARRLAPRLASASGMELARLVSSLDGLGVAPPEPALPVLLRLLDEGERRLLWWATPSLARVLGRYGGRARPALPGLRRLAEREVDAGRSPRPAVEAILRIDPGSPEARAMAEALARLHRDARHTYLAREVIAMLAGMGPPARAALPILRETARAGRTPARRDEALRAIDAIGAAVGD